jgi:catechol 2,3-dioxygenase-like lactoylglutathione lyase family enzyme
MAIEMQGLCPLLQVFDMPKSVGFYRDVLGFEVVTRSPTYAMEGEMELFHWIWLRLGSAELMLNTAYDEGERPNSMGKAREAVHGDTTLYFDCVELEAAREHLLAHGVACGKPQIAGPGRREISFRDPDGYGIVLHHVLRT